MIKLDLGQLLNLPEGGNYTLINSLYDKPRKQEDGKYDDGMITLIYKDNETNELLKYEIEDPMIEGYRIKPEYGLQRPELYLEEEKLDKIDLSYAHRARDIAKMLGPDATRFYYDCIKNGNRSQAEKFIRYKDFFSTDVDIEDFYRIKSLEYFGIHEPKISKGYLDIEVDIIKDKYFDVENSTGEAPINAVTIINGRDKQCYTLLLRDDTNPQIEELENDLNNFIVELEDTFNHIKWFEGMKYGVKFFDTEIDLIIELFNIIHYLKLDFMMIWNMRFDIRYIINRITGLGYDPHEIMTASDMKSDTCYFILDRNEQSAKDLTKRSDDFMCASYTKYIDQMLLYAQVRKSKALPSYKLDAIGEKEIKEGKVSYSDIGNIATFPKRDYRKFVIYNIKDVLIQYGIEEKVKDIDFMFHKAYESGTRYSKCFKETIYNRNLGYMYFKRQGQILGNNQNVGVEEKKEKYEGAVVGNPALNEKTGMIILGHRSSSIINDLQDQDVESEYPTVITTCNIDAKTQIGRVIANKDNMTKREIYDDYEKYDRGGKFLDDLQIREPLLFMYRWHNLPGIAKVIEGFKKFNPNAAKKKLFKERKRRKLFKNR